MELGIKTIGNATIIGFDRKPILATDPWLQNKSAYFGSWTLPYSIPKELENDLNLAEFIWFSHGHPDHINPDSISNFKEKKILLSNHIGNRIKDNFCDLGFNVHILPDRQWTKLSERIKVFSIADFAQNSILLMDINSHLFVNLNDSPPRWWGKTVERIIKKYKKSYLLTLAGAQDADMINFYDEDGNHTPRLMKTGFMPIGMKHYKNAKRWGTSAVIPFSSFHAYQRSDTEWINNYIITKEDHSKGFPKNSSIDLLEPFIRVNCLTDEISSINPKKLNLKIYSPEDFGDNWSDLLEKNEFNILESYFLKKEKLRQILGFINFNVGNKDNFIQINKNLNTGITFTVPRNSLMMAIKHEIFDDLLIGNFMKTTLHNIESLYNPNFSLYVTKIADNGGAQSLCDIENYFHEYKSRAYMEYILTEFQASSLKYLRNIIHKNKQLTTFSRKIYSLLK